MSEHNPFRTLADQPPSPHRETYDLHDSPTNHSPEYDRDEPFDHTNVGQGYLAPSHAAAPSPGPPDFENMPVPVSYLPPGAAPPQRFYGALGVSGDPQSRDSFASSQTSLNELGGRPTPGFGYRDSDYNSVSRLRPESYAGSAATTYGEETPRMSSYGTQGTMAYRDDDSRGGDYMMEDLQQASNKNAMYAAPQEQKRKRTRWLLILGIIIVVLAIAAALVYFFVIKKHDDSSDNKSGSGGSSSSGGHQSTTSGGGGKSDLIVTGGDGSTVTMDDGTTFTYHNAFGGTWYYDPNDPYNNNAQAQSWTPPLNTSFKFGTDKIYGFVSFSPRI